MASKNILVVDDDPLIRASIGHQLRREGFACLEAETAEKGHAMALENPVDLVLLDINMPVMGGEALLAKLRDDRPGLPLVVLTGNHDTDLAVRCIKAGAEDFLTKPCESARLLTTLHNVLRLRDLENRLREVQGQNPSELHYDSLYGKSEAMQRVFDQLRILEKSDIGVLIEGPSGTGKELVARALHRRSTRSDGPFVAINCGAIPETMLESELFGHEKGSFTGAINSRAGCFEQANKGTLFLDEIGEMRPDMQVRLLRSLENREVRRLGATKTMTFDVRVVAATNRDLKERVGNGSFREDLFYRLAVFRLALPTLNQRGDDVVGLAERFTVDFAGRLHKRMTGLDQDTVTILKSYTWPGNVRELRNVIERATLMAEAELIRPQDLPEEILDACPDLPIHSTLDGTRRYNSSAILPVPAEVGTAPGVARANGTSGANLSAVGVTSGTMTRTGQDEILPIEQEERRIFQRALRLTHGDVAEAARKLGIGRATLYRRIKELQLDANDREPIV